MTSVKITAVSLCAVVCLASLGLAVPDAAAQEIGQLKGPDLVVEHIALHAMGAGREFTGLRVTVRVRNRGNGAAAGCTVALYVLEGASGNQGHQTKTMMATGAGGSRDLHFDLGGTTGVFQGMLTAVADIPVTAHPAGKIKEGSPLAVSGPGGPPDLNNGFTVIADTTGLNLPIVWKNPAAQ